MKKHYILDLIIYLSSIFLYILFLVLNRNNNELFFYKSYLIYFGIIIPFLYLIIILIKELKIKEYITDKYSSYVAYGIIISNGFIYTLMINVIKEEVFKNIHILLWVLTPILYLIFIIIAILISKKNIKNGSNNKIKINH